MMPDRRALFRKLTTKWMPLLCLLLMQNAFAWEGYEFFGDKNSVVVVKRDKSDPRYTLKAVNGKITIENEEMFPFDKPGFGELEEDIFASGKAPANSECYFTPIMMTICWVPVGTAIVKRGYASEAFQTKTGVVMCGDSVAGRGPCMDVRRIQTSKK